MPTKDEFTVKLSLKPEIDTSASNQMKKDIENMVDTAPKSKLGEVFKRNVEDFKNEFKIHGSLGQSIAQSFKSVADSIGEYFKDAITSAFEQFEEIASYSLGQTIRYNPTAWSTAMNYGLTGAQGYAFNQAMAAIGVSSESDLYQAMMSPSLQQAFQQYFKEYEEEYERNKDYAIEVENYQKEMRDFKRDFNRSVMEFFTNNKDLIVNFYKVSFQFMETILELVGNIASFFGDGSRSSSERISATTDIINNYKSSNSSNVNIKMDNSFNGTYQNERTWFTKSLGTIVTQLTKQLI